LALLPSTTDCFLKMPVNSKTMSTPSSAHGS
jgi:hypothetical protein